MAHRLAAVDLGATSGRVMVGTLTGAPTPRLHVELVRRFANTPLPRDGHLFWDLPALLAEIRAGLAAAAQAGPLASIGVDSWAVDYSLLTPAGASLPHHYRDARTATGVERVHGRVPFADLYQRNGLQFLPFNTLYQLATENPADLTAAAALLLIPDLVTYELTGECRAEYTNASTTGLLATTGEWDTELIETLGYGRELFQPLVRPGELIGPVTDPQLPAVGGVPVLAVGSHDTASAVAAVPMDPCHAAYISCGTWALVGVETSAPITTTGAREANFTNEGGVDGTNRFLHNVMGMWLLNESIRTWDESLTGDGAASLPDLLEAAAALTPPAQGWRFDVNDPVFLPPGDMPARIQDWFTTRGLPAPQTPVEIVRAIVESLAVAFAKAARAAADLAGVELQTIHIVGGGSLNELLCQRTADLSGLPVVAGPVEATAIGNLLVQARYHGLIGGSLADLRRVVAHSFTPQPYLPHSG